MPSAAAAQNFEGGIKVGFAITSVPLAGEVLDQVVGQPSIESSSKVGLTGGGFVRFPMTDRLSFQPEALFVMKGVKLTEAAGAGTVSARLHYLDVPLLVRFRSMINPQVPAYVFGGPNFGVKLGSSATLKGLGQTTDIDIDRALKTLDLGFALGAGIEQPSYFVEARFTRGITDIGDASFPHPDRLRNRAFSVLVGMNLR
jgi:hypothetical protein